MPTNSTGAGSQDKYERWFPLLEKELGLVAKSDAKIISIGKRWADSSPARGFTAMSERFLSIRGGPPGGGGMKLSARIGRENSWYSPEAELAAAREQVRALQELADYRGKLLDEAEWRYRELLEELRRSHPGDGVGGPSDRVRRVFGIAPTGGGGDKVYHWPNIPPPFTPRAMRFWASGPGGRRPALEIRWSAYAAPNRCGGCSRSRSLDTIGCQGSSSFMLRPAGGLSLNATTAGAVRLVQLRPDAGGCFRPPQGSWKSGRKAIGQLSRYAKQTYSSLIRHGSVCNTFQ